MKRINRLSIAILVAGFFLVGARVARADVINVPTTFAAADASDGFVDNVYNVAGDLTITSTGSITCNDPATPTAASACPITIVVTGKLLMEAGSAITADNNVDGGNAGNITITVGTDMTMCGPNGGQPGCLASGIPGALISAQKKSGGATTVVNSVTITVGDKLQATGNFYMEGGVTTYGAETGARIDTTSNTGHAGNITITAGKTYFTEPGSVIQAGDPLGDVTATAQGGKIFLVADCGLTSQGRVTSKGPDFGADLVHLESCTVLIEGLVESTGKGHVAGAKNSCDLVNDGLPGEVLRDHPAASTGCVEVWGNFIKIDSTPPWAGELNADIGDGGPEGTSWIDIFAFSDLTVIDGTGNDRVSDNFGHIYASTYAVHANALAGSDHNPAVVTALVKNGPLTASGRAFEASSTLNAFTGHGAPTFVGNGSDGGTIRLEASGTVTLDDAFVNASGDFFGGVPCPSGSGACGAGGHIIVSAWGAGSDLLWRNGDGDVRNNDDSTDPPPPAILGGTIDLNACDLIDTTGTNFHGEVPTETHICDATKPDIPVITAANAGPVFKSDLWALCGGSSVSGIKFNDLDGNHVRNGAEPVLPGWEIKIWNATQTVLVGTTNTLADGSYTFTVPAGSYVVCETLQAGWLQTAPVAGAGVVACTNIGAAPLGYTIDLSSNGTCTGTQVTGKDFGNIQQATKSGTKWNDVNGNHIREAGDNGLDGWVIHLYGTAVNGSAVHQTFTTAGGGNYSFTVLPGSYTVCEALQAGWTQTFPVAGPGIVACTPAGDPAADNPTPGPLGYAIVLTGGEIETGNDFGNFKPDFCEKLPVRTVLNGRVPDTIVRTDLGQSIQAAVTGASDTNGDNSIIVGVVNNGTGALGGHVYNQSVVISKVYDLPFLLIGCSVTLHDPTPTDGNPVIQITSTAFSPGTQNIFSMDLHTADSGYVGFESTGNGRYIRNTGSSNNAINFKVTGFGNTMHNGSATYAGKRSNGTLYPAGPNVGVGFWLIGNSNLMTDTTIQYNRSHGILAAGDSNQFLKMQLGDVSGRGNLGDGLNLSGSSNVIRENTARTNTLDGIHIVSGTNNTLKKNVSGGTSGQNNLDCEYRVVAGNINLGENKSNNVTVPGAVGSAFPTGCTGSP